MPIAIEKKSDISTVWVSLEALNHLHKIKLQARLAGKQLSARAIATRILLSISEAEAAKLLELDAA